MIAVIGFGVTLAVTNENELQMEKEKAICMMEQTIEYTDSQIAREKSYLNMYNKGTITGEVLLKSDVISIKYYDNILANEVILQNANMNTYGEIMKYLAWVEYYDSTAKTAEDDSSIYAKLYNRYANMKKVKEMLVICCDEMKGEITEEEAAELRKGIKYGGEDSSDKDESKYTEASY